jgi:uroporphyrin-3 C-methyltransferase
VLGWVILLVAVAAAIAAAWFAWTVQLRVRELEAELVKRQQASQDQAADARTDARQALDAAREAAAKAALLEVRVAESAVQRTQIEELMQSVARSRDENVLADVEAALRVAMQQGAITGSAEPIVIALQQAKDRLSRYSEPQLERVRRAIATDLERAKAVAVTDIAALTVRLDEAIRLVDELPLLVRPAPRTGARSAAAPAPAASAASAAESGWRAQWSVLGSHLWSEVRSLVRVTPIDRPEAMLIAPEQAYFLRENLKLRLLNARLALLSRQFDTAQSDLRDARSALDRYFERDARAVKSASELVHQVAGQARLVALPRPDATLAAIAAASAGR